MKRIIISVFLIALVFLFAWLWLNRSVFGISPRQIQSVRTIVPAANGNDPQESIGPDEIALFDDSRNVPLFVLNHDETFIQALSWDLNRDGAADQISAIKKAAEPYIYLITALQNPITGEYKRTLELRTGVTQTRTLAYYFMDIIGDRTNALIYTGMTADNMQTLAVYLPIQEKDSRVSFQAIADLRSDGPISIQEIRRSDAYNLGLTGGESYPIITYNSDPDAPDTLDQIERVYRWNRTIKRYELSSEARIAGKKIESKLIGQLQSGNQESFENFLAGLWYVPESRENSGTRYLFFEPAEDEIVFYQTNTQEVFLKESASPRRYGMYITARNRSIPSIRRLINIELTGIDEIKVKILEDVKLKIAAPSDWDGVYRKMSSNPAAYQTAGDISTAKVRTALASGRGEWLSSSGQTLLLLDNQYTLKTSSQQESGSFALLTVFSAAIFQFRPAETDTEDRFYTAKLDSKLLPDGSEQQTLQMTEVQISLNGIRYLGASELIWERTVPVRSENRDR